MARPKDLQKPVLDDIKWLVVNQVEVTLRKSEPMDRDFPRPILRIYWLAPSGRECGLEASVEGITDFVLWQSVRQLIALARKDEHGEGQQASST